MNTQNFTVSETAIRATSHNLKNLFNLAEAQNFPFDDFKAPSLLSIMNAVSKSFGYSSVKGMSVALEGGLEISKQFADIAPIDLDLNLKRSNPEATPVRILSAKKFTEVLFNSLISNPLSKAESELLAHFQVHKLHKHATQTIFMTEIKTYQIDKELVNSLIKVAFYSNILYCSHLSRQGISEVLSIKDQLNFNTRFTENHIESWNNALHAIVEKNSTYTPTDIISSFQFDKFKFKAHFNENQNFVNIMVKFLRSNLIDKLLLNRSTKATGELMAKYIQSYDSKNLVPADDVQEALSNATVRAIGLLMGKINTGIESFRDFELDANGLLTPRFIAVMYKVFDRTSKHNFKFKNMNQFYWTIQRLSADLLRNGDHTNMVAATYVDHVVSNFEPIVIEHFNEIQGTEFNKFYNQVRAAVIKK